MNELNPYNSIIQQQIDLIAKEQRDILEGKEGSSIDKLGFLIGQLESIKSCTPLELPALGTGAIRAGAAIGRVGY